MNAIQLLRYARIFYHFSLKKSNTYFLNCINKDYKYFLISQVHAISLFLKKLIRTLQVVLKLSNLRSQRVLSFILANNKTSAIILLVSLCTKQYT